jgi:hypothetical protein
MVLQARSETANRQRQYSFFFFISRDTKVPDGFVRAASYLHHCSRVSIKDPHIGLPVHTGQLTNTCILKTLVSRPIRKFRFSLCAKASDSRSMIFLAVLAAWIGSPSNTILNCFVVINRCLIRKNALRRQHLRLLCVR